MRLNRVKFQEIMSKKNLTEDIICHRTGLTSRSLRWIMNNGEVSEDALERIADAAEVETREIYLSDIAAFNDNVIEFLKGSERATVTFSQGRYKSRIKKLAANRPEECQIVAENTDGSMCAHVPTSWIKILPLAMRTETQRELSRERMLAYHLEHASVRHEKG